MSIELQSNLGISNTAVSSSENRGTTVETQTVSKTETIRNVAQENNQQKQDGSEVKEQLKEWVSKMNETMNSEKVRFSYSEDIGGIYVTVVDNRTQEVIRKIPTEDAIKLSAIWKEAVGNIFDRKG